MPRQSRSRPVAAAPRPAAPPPPPQKTQTRTASTAAAPPVAAQAPPAPVPHPGAAAEAGKPPGMLAQMAATAGSVAVGSTIGHGISSMLFGGSEARNPTPAEPLPAQPIQQQQQAAGINCEIQARDAIKCLETGDVQICSWYLEQLNACQTAARPY